MTQVFEKISTWIAHRDKILNRATDRPRPTLGFVPTMGALHAGHISLVEKSQSENDFTLVSIFVNPTQFNDPKDLEKYPRTFETDLKLLEKAGVDFLLHPPFGELYPDHYRYQLQENELSQILCGAHRPGHFNGVLSVVMKLLNIAGADHAYFGEKDYQQLLLIQGMAEAFFLRTQIIGCPTLREADGLPMSSRNTLLSREERKKAAEFPRILRGEKGEDSPGASKAPFSEALSSNTPSRETLPSSAPSSDPPSVNEIRARLTEAGFGVDYVEERFGRRFGAVKLGAVRLIDHVKI